MVRRTSASKLGRALLALTCALTRCDAKALRTGGSITVDQWIPFDSEDSPTHIVVNATRSGGFTKFDSEDSPTHIVVNTTRSGGQASHATLSVHASNSTQRINATEKQALQGAGSHQSKPSCACEKHNPQWKKCARTSPKCVFIDLGAANGNSFNTFLKGGFGALAACPGGQWDAVLVEANPYFKKDLAKLSGKYSGGVTTLSSTAAYMCDGSATFHVDTKTYPEHNYWGSSLSNAHYKNYLDTEVKVSLANLNRLLYEYSIASDTVIVKMDIEGAEWDIIPCLAQSPEAALLDKLFMEVHFNGYSLEGTTKQAFNQAVLTLRRQGVSVPDYQSPTL